MNKEVIFTHLKIVNFKGIKELEIDLSYDTSILGQNASGKSTIFDSITWCLFGKNSLNETKFNIKNTVDTTLNQADHIVELTMSVNGTKTVAKTIYKEKWVKKHGEEEREFTGNETLYFWNDVPLSAGNYSKKVSEVIEESVFKQVTNPLYFNVTMNKNERRDMLVRMAGDEITDQKVIDGNEAFRLLFERLKGQKNLEEYKKEIAFKKAILKKKVGDDKHEGEITIQIKELLRSNPEVENWAEIEAEITSKQTALAAIEKEINDITENFRVSMVAITAKQNEALQAGRKMADIKIELSKKSYAEASVANKDLNEAKYQLGVVRSELKTKERSLESETKHKEALQSELVKLREEWKEISARVFTFDRDACKCDKCLTPFKPEVIEEKHAEMQIIFVNSVSRAKAENMATGKAKAKAEAEITNSLITLAVEISDLKKKEQSLVWSETSVPAKPKEIEELLLTHAKYLEYKAINEQKIEIVQPDIADQKEMKLQIQEGIDLLKKTLQHKEQIERNAIRIEELKADEAKYGQELTTLEKQENIIDQFQEKKMSMIEEAVNGRFKLVKFRLFKDQVNGGKEPDCETMVGGVPFSDLNKAARLNAGIDCANAISEYYNISAPIVVDNAESINSFIPTKSQLIRLYVVPGTYQCLECGNTQEGKGKCKHCGSTKMENITPKKLTIQNN